MGNKSSKNKKLLKEVKNTSFKEINNINNDNLNNKVKSNKLKKSNSKKENISLNNSQKKESKNNNKLKSIKFFYNNKYKTIKYYDKFDQESAKKVLKSFFSIEESIEQIFFQDEEEDILILNSDIPDNILVNLFIRRDVFPKNPSNTLKITSEIPKEKSLLKFHWVLDSEEGNLKFKNSIVDKYIYRNTKYDVVHPAVKSSVTFTTGIHFFVLRISTFTAYESLRIVDDTPTAYNWGIEYKTSIGFLCEIHIDNLKYGQPFDMGILIDMDKKKCAFFDYDKKEIFCEGGRIPMMGKI